MNEVTILGNRFNGLEPVYALYFKSILMRVWKFLHKVKNEFITIKVNLDYRRCLV